MAPNIDEALRLIDEAHTADPRKTSSGEPYELHYAQKMTHYLDLHTPDASALLQVAVRAQHFRRWEVPRDSYPKTKPGYFAWRTFLKKRQSEQVKEICLTCGFGEEEAGRVASLIAKEELKKGEGKGDEEAQVLEDCACLVFLVSAYPRVLLEVGETHAMEQHEPLLFPMTEWINSSGADRRRFSLLRGLC